MNYPRLTQEQIMLNHCEFVNLISNVRRINTGLADLLMQNRNKLDRHMKAQESELEVMDRRTVCID